MLKRSVKIKDLAGIQYHGVAGITDQSLSALARLIQCGDKIEKAYLLSHIDNNHGCGTHCYLLTTIFEDHIAVKSGFTSGYAGEGPRGLSTSLQMLKRHNIDIEEYIVENEFIDRLDEARLLSSDLEFLELEKPVRPYKIYNYIESKSPYREYDDLEIQRTFSDNVPFSIIDIRIMDLAINLTENPDQSLMDGYRRLEDTIRKRAKLDDTNGVKLFSQVFQAKEPILHWPELLEAESKGRVSLFTGTYMAYRNKRAHKENDTDIKDAIREFLLLNQLFIMEGEAVNTATDASSKEKLDVHKG